MTSDNQKPPAEADNSRQSESGVAVGSTVLLACPFCGGEAKYVNTVDGGVCVECSQSTCMASSRVIYPNKTDQLPLLAESWNERDGELAAIGAKWKQNSSLEEWFPMTAEQIEQLRVQLAGCSVAALNGSESQEAKPYSYGWSPAYSDVLKLRREYERLRREVQHTVEHWREMEKDYRARAREWATGDPMHEARNASADMLGNCAYALGATLQANEKLTDRHAENQ
jgi:hypothetical protein